MDLSGQLGGIAAVALAFTADGEELAAVIPTEGADGTRVYLCAFAAVEGRTWLAFDGQGDPVSDRSAVRDAVSIAALCELAEESAAGGRPDELRIQLEELGRVEGHGLVAEADAALRVLQDAIEPPPRVASPAYLDRIGSSTRVLEQALGEIGASPFAQSMKHGALAVEALVAEVEGGYKLLLV